MSLTALPMLGVDRRLDRVLFGSLAAVLFLFSAPCARADGNEFFQSVHTGIKQLVFVGNVKDGHGNLIKGAKVTWDAQDSDDSTSPKVGYSTYTDELGHYRTIDVSLIMASMDYTLDPKSIELSVEIPGYKVVRRFRRAPDSQEFGSIEIDFVVAPNDSAHSPLAQRLRMATKYAWTWTPKVMSAQ